MNTWQNCLYVTLILLVPLFPAYVLYKALKSSGLVSGPFAGLHIDLGGAFAGYFLLVVVALMFLYGARPTPQEPGQMWMVTGHLTYTPSGDQYPVTQTLVQTIPPADIDENGNFRIYVLRSKDSTNAMRFPDLQFSSPGYRPATVHLDGSINRYAGPSYKLTPDELNHAISIEGDIVLAKDTTGYNPEGSLAIH